MLYAYHAAPKMARPPIRWSVYSLHRAKLGSVRPTPSPALKERGARQGVPAKTIAPGQRLGASSRFLGTPQPGWPASRSILADPVKLRVSRARARARESEKLAFRTAADPASMLRVRHPARYRRVCRHPGRLVLQSPRAPQSRPRVAWSPCQFWQSADPPDA